MYNVRIQLATGYLDVKEDTAFPLNFGVADIRDVSKRAGAFSKTITLVGNKNNHDLLNHYYDVNIVAGTFDINALTKCTVVQNGIPILADAFVQLLSVNKIQKDTSFEQDIEYSVLIKDQASTFFTDIDTKELRDIDYSDLNHAINSANIYSSFTHDVTDGYKYGLTWMTGNLYNLSDFRPAIYAKVYFDRIFQNAGYNYDWSSLAACGFDKLLIPYNGDLVTIDYSNYTVEATHAADIVSIVQTPYTAGFTEPLTGFVEIVDTQALFNPATGVYTCAFPLSGAECVNVGIDIVGDVQLVNATAGDLRLLNTFFSYTSLPKQRYYLEIRVFRSAVAAYPISTYSIPYDIMTDGINSAPFAPGTTTIISLNNSYIIPVSNVLAGEQLTFEIGLRIENSNTSLHWVDNAVVDAIMTPQLNYTSLKLSANISSNTLSVGTLLNMNQFVPDKIKQKDFVKSIFQMFNLYVEIDTNNANTLILKTRDDFYDSGVEKDWTYKLAKDKEQILNFLPELASKKLILTYKQDKDTPNVTYYDTTREIYGQVEYVFDNEYVKGIDTKELIFSPSPIGQTIFGAYVPIVAGSSPKTNLRILYDGGMKSCSQYTIIDSGSAGLYGILEYPLMHHYDDALNPTLDINFALCDFMFYDDYTPTDNNLYNSYWRRTISQINTGKMLIAYFNLKEDDIQKLKLNDKIRIDNSWWSINKIIDYDANNKQLTKVELLSTDSEIDFAPFITKKPIKPHGGFSAVYTGVNQTITDNSNTVGIGADAYIKGKNNIIMPNVKCIIEGDGFVVSEDGIYRGNDNINTINDNYANADLTFDDNRNHSTNGFDLIESTDGGNLLQSYRKMTPSNSEYGFEGYKTKYDSTKVQFYADNNLISELVKTGFIHKSSVTYPQAVKTANYSFVDSDYLVNCTANSFNVTLPTAVGRQGKTYVVKNSGTGTISFLASGGQLIDGAASWSLSQYDYFVVQSTGSNWVIISSNTLGAITPSGYYGAFQDNTIQTAAAINTPYAMRFGITDLSNTITIVSDGSYLTRITIANTGVYNIQFSAQFDRTNSGTDTVDIWLRKNGVDVPGSGGKIVLTGGVIASAIIAAWNYVLDVVAGDYYQIMWSTPDTHVRLLYEAAQTTPFTHPLIPSTILTVTQQAGIMAGTGITALNGLSADVQLLSVGTSGTDFNISSATSTHTFNLPTASATNRGALSSANWSTFNGKQNAITLTTTGTGAATFVSDVLNIPTPSSGGGLTIGTTAITSGTVGRILFEGTGNLLQEDSNLFWDNTNKRLGIGATPATTVRLDVRAQGALSTDIAFRVRNSADTANILTVNGDGTQNWFEPANNTLSSIKSGTYNLIQWGNNNFGNVAVGYSSTNMITPTLSYCTLLGTFTSVLASGGTRVGNAGGIGVGGDYGIAIGYGTNVKGNSTIHIGRRTGASSMSGLNSIHLGKTPSGNDIAPSNVFMTHFDSENASTLARGNGSFGLLGKTAYILGDGIGTYGVDKFMGNGGNTLVITNHTLVPSTNIVDTFQMYSNDIIAGNAAPHFRTENGGIIKLYQETTAVAASTFVVGIGTAVTDASTFDGYTLKQIVKALRNQGLLT